MAYGTDPSNPDLAALASRRADVREFVEDIAAHVRGLGMPETYRAANSVVRAITLSDRFLQAVPPPEPGETAEKPSPGQPAAGPKASPVRDPHRLALRDHADQVMAAVRRIPKPASFLEGERAVRYALSADRMLVQLYTPPKPARPADDAGDDAERIYPDDLETWKATLLERLLKLIRNTASCNGYWPDGSPYDREHPDYWQATPSEITKATAAANEAAGKPVPLLEEQRRLLRLRDSMSREEFRRSYPGFEAFLPP